MPIAINFLAVLGAAVAAMIVGALWYSPLMFGNLWMKLTGFSQEKLNEMKKGMRKSYALMFVSSVATAFVLAHIMKLAAIKDTFAALQLGFWLWFGFSATIMLGAVLWEGKSYKWYLLNIAHQLVALEVMAVVLALWQ